MPRYSPPEAFSIDISVYNDGIFLPTTAIDPAKQVSSLKNIIN